MSNMITMLLMRATSGVGKSTLAKQIKQYNESCHIKTEIFSTDNFWLLATGEYRFDAKRLGIAHEWNQRQVEIALDRQNIEERPDCVIIDNTNLRFEELIPYLKIAKNRGIPAFEVVPNTPWMYNTDELVKRNQHGVPRETIERMLKKFEPSLQSRITEYLLT